MYCFYIDEKILLLGNVLRETSDELLSDNDEIINGSDSDLEFERTLSDASIYEDHFETSAEQGSASEEESDVSDALQSKSGIRWDSNYRPRKRTRICNFVTEKSGLINEANDVFTIVDFFSLFFRIQFWKKY